MKRLGYPMLFLFASLTLAACSGRSNSELTLVARNVAMGTEIADLRASATVAADRLNITVEYMQTAVTEVARQNQMLSSTLTALGQNPGAVVPQPNTLALIPTPGINSNSAPVITPDAPAQNAGAITPSPSGATLYNAVMAEAVGKNDCALAPITSFKASIERIYVVATAANVAPGTKLASRWMLEGKEVVSHDFTPDFAIQQNCVWFFIDPKDTPFTPGNWSVQLEINGTSIGSPVPFTIAG
jgi:hypothetical protein